MCVSLSSLARNPQTRCDTLPRSVAGHGGTHNEALIKLNELLSDGATHGEIVEQAADTGADTVGFRPWYDNGLQSVVDTNADTGVDVAYLSGGSPVTDGPAFPLSDYEEAEGPLDELRRAISVSSCAGAET
ncbi:MAG: hypothetical protein RI560_06760 [Natronomonas sp.]|nr:hypothetical protein [Natronomonas sp.]